ncbi:MAG: transglutaminase domain-containing protein [Theionarchaea archaeon]|nr:transglutaminase domain-containing protein [Theionarchaea archaeon]
MRKGYAAGILLILLLSSFSHILGDEFKTKSMYDLYNPLIVQIASELKKSTDIETAEAVWDWMNSNIQYEFFPERCDVDYTLREKKGNCSNHAFLSASLLLAAGFENTAVRIGEGANPEGPDHAWTEIYTDRWHKFDTVRTCTFKEEYSSETYQEGEKYIRIDYYYYDTREDAEIVLIDVKQTLLKDIHAISFVLKNEGEIRKFLKIEVTTALEIIGSSGFELTIEGGETRETKIFLRGEGAVMIQIDEIIYETELFYKDSEKKESLESAPEQPSQAPSEASYTTPEELRKKDIEIKKIILNSPEKEEARIVRVNSEQKNPYMIVLLFPLVFLALFIIKRM